ncbi:aminoglycoside phosphotransferase family protein [Pseudomonas sp.]|uniref:aminoglycoside phosphotransferase family protein n=1 Tax=Pseudomonas sp. TaxID=306 RepID=UPI002735ECA3|nr:phosphotransferase [Pseudomonas sp.]MDP3813929.1 phosphotransferase [Pseudomonas sp.]
MSEVLQSHALQQVGRATARAAFLARAGYPEVALEALPADASSRRYFRLSGAGLLLMDSPPASEPIGPYLQVAGLLQRVGLSAPQILAVDEAAGLALIEDFGADTYTRLLAGGQAAQPLYQLAVETLAHLHRAPLEHAATLAPYNAERLAEEYALFIDWYAPLLIGTEAAAALRADYMQLFAGICREVAGRREALVLRDFHVDNLMLLEGRQGVAACGLLDFQDALQGAAAYDLLSLLEDARRDMPAALRADLLQHYLAQRPQLDAERFMADYAVLAAQRHAKVLGIFVRLARRDGKLTYLKHLPRTLGLFSRALDNPALQPLRHFLEQHLGNWRHGLSAEQLARVRGPSL